jgi:hypothetical protein
MSVRHDFVITFAGSAANAIDSLGRDRDIHASASIP